jgi:hypothetical protein
MSIASFALPGSLWSVSESPGPPKI